MTFLESAEISAAAGIAPKNYNITGYAEKRDGRTLDAAEKRGTKERKPVTDLGMQKHLRLKRMVQTQSRVHVPARPVLVCVRKKRRIRESCFTCNKIFVSKFNIIPRQF